MITGLLGRNACQWWQIRQLNSTLMSRGFGAFIHFTEAKSRTNWSVIHVVHVSRNAKRDNWNWSEMSIKLFAACCSETGQGGCMIRGSLRKGGTPWRALRVMIFTGGVPNLHGRVADCMSVCWCGVHGVVHWSVWLGCKCVRAFVGSKWTSGMKATAQKEITLLFSLTGQLECAVESLAQTASTAPATLQRQIHHLRLRASRAADLSLPYLQATSPRYYRSFKHVVEKAFRVLVHPFLVFSNKFWREKNISFHASSNRLLNGCTQPSLSFELSCVCVCVWVCMCVCECLRACFWNVYESLFGKFRRIWISLFLQQATFDWKKPVFSACWCARLKCIHSKHKRISKNKTRFWRNKTRKLWRACLRFDRQWKRGVLSYRPNSLIGKLK